MIEIRKIPNPSAVADCHSGKRAAGGGGGMGVSSNHIPVGRPSHRQPNGTRLEAAAVEEEIGHFQFWDMGYTFWVHEGWI